VKVVTFFPRAQAISRALLAITLSMAFLFSPSFTHQAHAITRAEVLRRANSWVAKRVRYSQRSTYQGYRRDCSGMVSMAWGLGRSYSSRTISSRARRISAAKLRPGDAVLTPGHVEIFGGWKNKKKGTYLAIGQTTWGGRATVRVRKLSRRAVGLRLKSISEAAPVAARVAPQMLKAEGIVPGSLQTTLSTPPPGV
jgi:hypothetical protein